MLARPAPSVYLMRKIRFIYAEPIYNAVTYCFDRSGRALRHCLPARPNDFCREPRHTLGHVRS